jgi:regulatory protein
MTGPRADAYLAALHMLGRRELSEAQIRQRLARKGYPADEIDDAVARLRDSRALDDARVAEAIARTETAIRGRGRHRVLRRIEAAGIGRADAQHAVDAIYSTVDAGALLGAAIAKRLRGRTRLEDDAERQRLYRYLVGQGFDIDAILRALEALR